MSKPKLTDKLPMPIIYAIVLFLVSIAATKAFSAEKCSRYCNIEVSKPCGKSCIAKDLSCHKSWTTACFGERPASSKPVYENPKKVDVAPDAGKK